MVNLNEGVNKLRSRASGGLQELRSRADVSQIDVRQIKATVTGTFDKVTELGLHLPVGLYTRARDELAHLDAKRVQKLIDDMIARGQKRLEPIERRLRRDVGATAGSAKVAAEEKGRVVKATADKGSKGSRNTAARAKGPAGKTATEKPTRAAAPKSARRLPIADYDSLTVEQINNRLDDLTPAQRESVRAYESATKKRATVLQKLDTLSA